MMKPLRILNGFMVHETPKPELRELLDAWDVHYKDVDGNQKIKCFLPDHDDRNPSASVNLGEGLWSCFSCQKGGDSWTALMEVEHLDFRQATERGKTFGTSIVGNPRGSRRKFGEGMGYKPRFGVRNVPAVQARRRHFGPPQQ
jgi:hypothetical protein